MSVTDEYGKPTLVRSTVTTERVTGGGAPLYRATVVVDAGTEQAPGTPAKALSPQVSEQLADNDEVCRTDGSLSVRACITTYYGVKNDDYYYFINVTKYTAKWIRLDNQARIMNGWLKGLANGRTCGGGQLNQAAKEWNRSCPTSGAAYNFTPPWAGTYVMVSSQFNQGQKVFSTLTWGRGTKTYTLNANYALPDDGGWAQYGGC